MQTGTVTRTTRIKHPQHYLQASGDPARQGACEVIPREALRFEFLMNALRLRQGFDVKLFTAHTGLPINAMEPELSACLEDGLLERDGQQIRCSTHGFNFLDTVLQRFLP